MPAPLAEPKVIGHQHHLRQHQSVDETDAVLLERNMPLRQDDILMQLQQEEHHPEIGEHRREPCKFMQGFGLQAWFRVSHAAFPRSPELPKQVLPDHEADGRSDFLVW